MSKRQIYGYIFAIAVKKSDWGYVAYCPGIQGVYEEAKSRSAALRYAYESACAILETQLKLGEAPAANAFLRPLTEPPSIRSFTVGHPKLSAKKTEARISASNEYLLTAPCNL